MTEVAAFIVTVHVPVPVQPPLQPVKTEPAAGPAVKVTWLPLVNEAAQVAPQETPAGALAMVPLPVPDLATTSVTDCAAKVAVTGGAAFTVPAGLLVTVPLPVPVVETVSVDVDDVDTPVPVTIDERVSPSAAKLTLVLATAVLVGAKRTVTVWVALAPTRVKGLPETMLKGAETEAVPVTVPPRVF